MLPDLVRLRSQKLPETAKSQEAKMQLKWSQKEDAGRMDQPADGEVCHKKMSFGHDTATISTNNSLPLRLPAQGSHKLGPINISP